MIDLVCKNCGHPGGIDYGICDNCTPQCVKQARLHMITERITAKNDFDLFVKILKEQYIELRTAPLRDEYERLLELHRPKKT